MISDEIRHGIWVMHAKGMKIRQISRSLGGARNTVRTVIHGDPNVEMEPSSSCEKELPVIVETYHTCQGNVVRVQEMLRDQGIDPCGSGNGAEAA
ncbi:MAG: hypothetical protein FJY85_09235 [Deltaproteobacteria bacterium]|nr:hypothetical protein [Deltaproteobacteria bacterium]